MSPGRDQRVGIVVVSYGASTAVRCTLASLRAAKNETSSELVLIDNASRGEERMRIRSAMQHHIEETGSGWRHLQQDKNLGFSGGNNVGIREFLRDPAITHICLLNSDVIVPHSWLDRMLEPGLDIISAVTNKSASEQCVPVDYELSLADCLDEDGEALNRGVFATVDGFAQHWHGAWRGNVVDCDPTFFCVILSRVAIEKIGLLDEAFFPGGFEDDDYCARARESGIPTHLARGVFIHHWGSASFGELTRDYFNENARRNLSYLEQKHDFVWRRRPEKPFVSFAQDVGFALSGAGDRRFQAQFLSLYRKDLGKLLDHYLIEFANLRSAVSSSVDAVPDAISSAIQAVGGPRELDQRWGTLLDEVDTQTQRARAPVAVRGALLKRLVEFARDVHDLMICNYAIHEFLSAQDPVAGVSPPPPPLWRRIFSMIRHGVPFFLRLRGIVFFGGYPYPEREKDGYFQRIRAIDRMFEDRWRIYFDPDPLPGQVEWYHLPAPRTLVLRRVGGRMRRALVVAVVWVLAIRCRATYFHSVLRMQEMGFGRLLSVPFTKRVLDVHGVVPEEFRMHNDFYHAVLFEAREQTAVRRANCVIVVTEAMKRYVDQKYGDRVKGDVVVLPIFPGLELAQGARPYVDGQPIVVYAGGLHKWQQVPKMVDAIVRTRGSCLHRFYCPDPAKLIELLPDDALEDGRVVVESKSHDELIECYRECHFGFVLRQDSVVNHVACPTKVVEYLAMGIVPIVDCEQIGDFAEFGMQCVRRADFVAGRVPDAETRDQMALANFAVYARLRDQRTSGATRIRRLFGSGMAAGRIATRALWHAGKALPPDTIRGRVARATWRTLRGRRGKPAESDLSPSLETAPDIVPCDVLVQVGHFLAGGLENAVLDLNEALQEAGFRVSMLVLGDSGAGVVRAIEQGVPVCVGQYSDDAYQRWIRVAAPKVVISHYSVEGAAICGAMEVSLVQVIHNIYLWLSAEELVAMRSSAAHTTAFVAASSFAKDYSVERLGVPDDKCVVIPYGIEVQRFRDGSESGDRELLRVSLRIGPEDFVFLNVSAINHQKNHLSLLKSFLACATECADVRLVVVGPVYEQDLFDACCRFVDDHDLNERVTFTGGVSDPHRYYAMADAYVHSAFFEGGPLTVLESLAANLPIVSVATGLAIHFEGQRGVHLVRPHFDVARYHGHLTAMKGSGETEEQFATAMQRVMREREPPDLPASVVDSFDRSNAYSTYVELVRGIIGGSIATKSLQARSWAGRLPSAV